MGIYYSSVAIVVGERTLLFYLSFLVVHTITAFGYLNINVPFIHMQFIPGFA